MSSTKSPKGDFFFVRGVGGSPPTPLTIKKPGCQGKSFDSLSREIFDANFLEKDLAKPRFKAYAVRMKIEFENAMEFVSVMEGLVLAKEKYKELIKFESNTPQSVKIFAEMLVAIDEVQKKMKNL